MLSPQIEAALNAQLNREQTAAHEYLAMSAYFVSRNLDGFATFMRKQYEEELSHAMRLFDHIADRGGTVMLASLPAPRVDFSSALDVFRAAQEWEKSNTTSIHDVYSLAVEQRDYATQAMLQWFIDEQVEEEKWCEEAVALLELAGSDSSALLMLDRRYGETARAGAG